MTMRFSILLFFISIVAFGTCLSSAALEKPPVLPELTFKRLLNDLQVIVASTPHLGESMTMGLVVRYGSTFDPSGKAGLAYLMSRMFANATLDRSAKDIQDELNYIGSRIEVVCDWDGIRFLLHGQSSKFERSLLLLYQVAAEAEFTDKDFARVKAEVLEELSKPEDPRQRIHSQLEAALFAGTTYGKPLRGIRASIQDISIGDVRYFYRRYFSPSASSLVVVGSAPTDLIVQKATRIWGVWVRKDDVPFTFAPPRKPGSRTIFLEDNPGSPAAQFILGNLWPRREDPSYYAATLAARILQDHLTKLLPTSLLTVGAQGRRLSGPFYIQGQSAADQAVGEIKKILDEVEAFKASPAGSEELTQAQNRWIDEFNKNTTSTDGICTAILDSELYRLGTNYSAMFPDLVRRNGPDAVKEAANEWILPGGMVLFVQGPAGVLKPGLELLGTVQTPSP